MLHGYLIVDMNVGTIAQHVVNALQGCLALTQYVQSSKARLHSQNNSFARGEFVNTEEAAVVHGESAGRNWSHSVEVGVRVTQGTNDCCILLLACKMDRCISHL